MECGRGYPFKEQQMSASIHAALLAEVEDAERRVASLPEDGIPSIQIKPENAPSPQACRRSEDIAGTMIKGEEWT
jgi:hypothetical protein